MVWLRRVKFRVQVSSAGEIWGNFKLSQSVFMSNVQWKKFRILHSTTWEIKIPTSQHLPSLKNVPINLLTALSTTDTYRFYFVKRETV